MSVSVNRQSIEVERMVGRAQAQAPVRAEALCSGAGRDSVEVLMEDACALLDGAQAQEGRVLVSGRVNCQAMYAQGQERAIRAVSAQAPFEQILEIEGAQPGMGVEARLSVEHVDTGYEAGRLVFTVTVGLWVMVRSLSTVEPVTGVEAEAAQTLSRMVRSFKTSAEAKEECTLQDSVALPAELDARVPLLYWARPVITESERDLGGVRVSGEAEVEAVVQSGVEERPIALIRVKLPFERLVGLPEWLEGECETEAQVVSLQMTVEPGEEEGERRLAMQCQLRIMVRVLGEDSVQVLEDAYLTQGTEELILRKEEMELSGPRSRLCGEENCRGTILLPEGAPPAGSVLCAHALPVTGGLRAQGEGTLAEGILEVCVLYLAAGTGQLCSARSELPFEVALPGGAAEDAALSLTVSGAEASSLMSDRLQFACRIQACAVSQSPGRSTLVTDVEKGEAEPLVRGVGVVFSQPGETLWSIARSQRLTPQALSAMNGGREEVAGGERLLVVRF